MIIWFNYLPLTPKGRVQPHASAPGISGATTVTGTRSSGSTSGWPFAIFRSTSFHLYLIISLPLCTCNKFIELYRLLSGFGGLGVACWPLVHKFTCSNPTKAVEFLRAKKSSARLPSSVPCRRFAACKRSLNLRGSRNLDKITGQFLAHSSTFRY